MIPRRLAPACSPVTSTSIWRGVTAILSGRDSPAVLRRRILGTYGCEAALTLDSGTSALAIAMAAEAREKEGLPVALPGYGCYDLATAADAAGVAVRLYDLDPETLGPDLDSLRWVLHEGVSAVVVAHLYGLPVDLAEISDLAREHGVDIIEDAAQGFGATYRGRPLGSSGKLGILSFGRGKGITGGGGGALLCRDAGAAESVRAVARLPSRSDAGLQELGITMALAVLTRPRLFWFPAAMPFLGLGKTQYRSPHSPRPIPTSCAAVVAENWEASLQEATVRVRNAVRLRARIRESRSLSSPPILSGAEPSYLRLPVLCTDTRPRSRILAGMEKMGVMSSYPQRIADLPGFSRRAVGDGSRLPGSRELAERLFTVPTHSLLTSRDVEALGDFLSGASDQVTGRSTPSGTVGLE